MLSIYRLEDSTIPPNPSTIPPNPSTILPNPSTIPPNPSTILPNPCKNVNGVNLATFHFFSLIVW